MTVMTTTTTPTSPATGSHERAVGMLARLESVRMLRHPLVVLGLVVSVWIVLSGSPDTEAWPGETYAVMMVATVPVLTATSLVVALAFHRERHDVGAAAPVGEAARTLAKLLAALPLVGLAALLATLVAWRERSVGGLWVGSLPWSGDRTVHTLADLGQYVALAVLAVALGAALGRRTARPAAFVAVLLVGWFVAATYWIFAHPLVTPFAVVQAQPIDVFAGPRGTDPGSFPVDWRLEPPGTFSDQWSRLLLSESLAWWHNLWLLGLAVVLISWAMPRGRAHRWVRVVGAVAAVTGLAGQFVVLP